MPFVAQPYHKNNSSFILIIMVILKLPFGTFHFGISIHSYCGDKHYKFLSNHLFQRAKHHGGWKEPPGNNKLL